MRPAAQSSAGYRIRYVANHAGRSDLTSACAADPTPVSLCSPSVALQLITTVRGAAAPASAASSADPRMQHEPAPLRTAPAGDAPTPASRAGWPV